MNWKAIMQAKKIRGKKYKVSNSAADNGGTSAVPLEQRGIKLNLLAAIEYNF
jgi:hypothetical protein